MKLPNGSYKFTDKKVSPFSVMSMVLSIISFGALFIMLIISFNTAGNVSIRMGTSSLLCFIFSLVALGLAIRTYFQKNVFHIFSNIGVGFSVVNLLYLMYIYGLGVMG